MNRPINYENVMPMFVVLAHYTKWSFQSEYMVTFEMINAKMKVLS